MSPSGSRRRIANLGLWALSSAAAAVLLSGQAGAAQLQAQERAAKKACMTGDPATGVAILADLFMDTGEPTYIYNQGRCYEQNNRCEDAIARFREYVRKANNASAAERKDVEKHIADCQALLAQGPTLAPGAAAAVVPPPSPPALTTVPEPPAQVVAASTPPARNAGRGLRIAGITCGAVGVASIGTGIYFYTRAVSYSNKVAKQPVRNPSDESAGKNAETMQWVFYGIGGAAIATGVVLYVLGRPSTAAAGPVATFAPLVGPGVAGLSAQGAF
jgi:hypothetical protein